MKKIKYNKYINKIGIEFEGFWERNLISNLSDSADSEGTMIADVKGDGSLEYDDNSSLISTSYAAREVVTNALKEGQVNTVLKGMNKYFKNEEYKINNTVGLHFHVSLNKYAFGTVCTPDFFRAYVDMFRRRFNAVYENRKNNRYCSFAIKRPAYLHFKRQSNDRYTVINYCLEKHNTVEFRGYGGKFATVEGLARMIQATIDLIDTFCNTKISYSKKFSNVGKIIMQRNYRGLHTDGREVPFNSEITLDAKNKTAIDFIDFNGLPEIINLVKSEQIEISLDSGPVDLDKGKTKVIDLDSVMTKYQKEMLKAMNQYSEQEVIRARERLVRDYDQRNEPTFRRGMDIIVEDAVDTAQEATATERQRERERQAAIERIGRPTPIAIDWHDPDNDS